MSLFVARNPAVAARVLDGELILMSLRDSSLFTLNGVATEIWQAADGRTPLDQIVRTRVCEKFDVEPATAYADAEEFCRKLGEHGVLLLSGQPVETSAPP
ncbi:MAG: PqqD family protein, partial [Bryobacteraceae bacterium]